MIKRYILDQGRVVEQSGDKNFPILFCMDLTDQEKAFLISQYNIDDHNLASALDKDELPRMELDNGHLAVIIKHPKRYNATDNLIFRIDSLGLFLSKEYIIIIAPEEMNMFSGRSFTKIQNLQMLMLKIFSSCISHFFSHLQVINDIANELENKIIHSMENHHLLQMFSIEKSLVYYVNAISANGRVIERLKTNARNVQTDGLTPEMMEFVDDLAIENAQCLEQAQVYANVFAGLMDARASIVNNNLNVLMKQLTVINVVFMPLNIIAGIGGMSEFSMMTQRFPWYYSYSLFILGLIIVGFITYWILMSFERKGTK